MRDSWRDWPKTSFSAPKQEKLGESRKTTYDWIGFISNHIVLSFHFGTANQKYRSPPSFLVFDWAVQKT
jgi:hypothetical protein